MGGKRPLFEKEIVLPALIESVKKVNPKVQIKNPVTIANRRIVYRPDPTPPGVTSPSIIPPIAVRPPIGV